jgi:methyl-accepting chemotaxis protein
MANRRHSIVINKPFQYQYSILVVALTVITVNLFVIIKMFYPSDQPLVMDMTSALGLAAIEGLLIAGVWYGSLKASHKIAGPIYVFVREVTKLGEGDFTANIDLRQKDMLQDVAADMNNSFAALRAKIVTLKDISRQLDEAQSQGGDTRELVSDLKAELSQLTTEETE